MVKVCSSIFYETKPKSVALTSFNCFCVTGEPRKFDPNFRGPVHNRYDTFYFLLITSHTAVKKIHLK